MLALEKTGRWSKEGARILIRAGYKCEYCGLDFFASPSNYRLWQLDHIVPVKHYGPDVFDNYAASCYPCNSIYKNQWDPRKVAGADASRDELIEATRKHIAQGRKADEGVIAEDRRLIGWEAKEDERSPAILPAPSQY